MAKTVATKWLALDVNGVWSDGCSWVLCDDVLWKVTNIKRPKRIKRLRAHVKPSKSGMFAMTGDWNCTIRKGARRIPIFEDFWYLLREECGLSDGDRFDLWLEWK